MQALKIKYAIDNIKRLSEYKIKYVKLIAKTKKQKKRKYLSSLQMASNPFDFSVSIKKHKNDNTKI